MTQFKNFSIITDGKFTGVWDASINSFYFGVYNHKYFSFQARYPVYLTDTIMDDFHEANEDELRTFLNDCKNLGYEYNPGSCKFMNYQLNTLENFFYNKLPKFVNIESFVGKTCIDQVHWNDYVIWIFSDNTYTMMQVSSYDCGDSVDFYSNFYKNDEVAGEHLINMWGHYSIYDEPSNNDRVSKNRHHWWYMISNMLKFNFYKSHESSIEELDKSIDNGEFTELGNVFIKHNMIDKEFIRKLAHEYFHWNIFNELTKAIRKKYEYQKALENANIFNGFDI